MCVLIETYWNVKYPYLYSWLHILFRINRNILECKGRKGAMWTRCWKVLIETYWNVKANQQRTVCNHEKY